jgi:hypothetical protein
MRCPGWEAAKDAMDADSAKYMRSLTRKMKVRAAEPECVVGA